MLGNGFNFQKSSLQFSLVGPASDPFGPRQNVHPHILNDSQWHQSKS